MGQVGIIVKRLTQSVAIFHVLISYIFWYLLPMFQWATDIHYVKIEQLLLNEVSEHEIRE
jgi:hypothetical protein